MAAAVCRSCWANNPAGSRFCGRCGAAIPPAGTAPGTRGRYSVLRFQVDPASPPPPWNWNWLLTVVGVAFVILGCLLLGVAGLIGSAGGDAGGGCDLGPCGPAGIATAFALGGAAVLLGGAAMVLVGLWRGLAPASAGGR